MHTQLTSVHHHDTYTQVCIYLVNIPEPVQYDTHTHIYRVSIEHDYLAHANVFSNYDHSCVKPPDMTIL